MCVLKPISLEFGSCDVVLKLVFIAVSISDIVFLVCYIRCVKHKKISGKFCDKKIKKKNGKDEQNRDESGDGNLPDVVPVSPEKKIVRRKSSSKKRRSKSKDTSTTVDTNLTRTKTLDNLAEKSDELNDKEPSTSVESPSIQVKHAPDVGKTNLPYRPAVIQTKTEYPRSDTLKTNGSKRKKIKFNTKYNDVISPILIFIVNKCYRMTVLNEKQFFNDLKTALYENTLDDEQLFYITETLGLEEFIGNLITMLKFEDVARENNKNCDIFTPLATVAKGILVLSNFEHISQEGKEQVIDYVVEILMSKLKKHFKSKIIDKCFIQKTEFKFKNKGKFMKSSNKFIKKFEKYKELNNWEEKLIFLKNNIEEISKFFFNAFEVVNCMWQAVELTIQLQARDLETKVLKSIQAYKDKQASENAFKQASEKAFKKSPPKRPPPFKQDALQRKPSVHTQPSNLETTRLKYSENQTDETDEYGRELQKPDEIFTDDDHPTEVNQQLLYSDNNSEEFEEHQHPDQTYSGDQSHPDDQTNRNFHPHSNGDHDVAYSLDQKHPHHQINTGSQPHPNGHLNAAYEDGEPSKIRDDISPPSYSSISPNDLNFRNLTCMEIYNKNITMVVSLSECECDVKKKHTSEAAVKKEVLKMFGYRRCVLDTFDPIIYQHFLQSNAEFKNVSYNVYLIELIGILAVCAGSTNLFLLEKITRYVFCLEIKAEKRIYKALRKIRFFPHNDGQTKTITGQMCRNMCLQLAFDKYDLDLDKETIDSLNTKVANISDSWSQTSKKIAALKEEAVEHMNNIIKQLERAKCDLPAADCDRLVS